MHISGYPFDPNENTNIADKPGQEDILRLLAKKLKAGFEPVKQLTIESVRGLFHAT